jgi:hypothetical protein
MGRGLSELQQTILVEALRIRSLPAAERHPCRYHWRDVTSSDIRAAYWGWQPISEWGMYPGDGGWDHRFSRRGRGGIGYRKGRSVDATLNRAFRRLEARGFLTHLGNGYMLTEAGLEWAAQLLTDRQGSTTNG